MGTEGTLPAPGKIRRGWRPGLAGTVIRIGTAIGVLGGVGVATYEAYKHDLLPVHQAINVPAIFDNANDNGTIGSNNILNIDSAMLSEINTVPSGPNPRHDIDLLTPFQNLPPNVNITYNKVFRGENQPLYSQNEIDYAKAQNIKDKIQFKDVPKDTVILAPVDGLLEFYMRPRVAPAGTIEVINFFYKNADGKIYQILMGPDSGFLKPLIDAKPFTYEKDTDESSLRVEVKRGQKIAMTLQTADFSFTTQTWPSGQLGTGQTYPNNINLISLPNDAGQEKLAILEK